MLKYNITHSNFPLIELKENLIASLKAVLSPQSFYLFPLMTQKIGYSAHNLACINSETPDTMFSGVSIVH
jgi:hypothetical protein